MKLDGLNSVSGAVLPAIPPTSLPGIAGGGEPESWQALLRELGVMAPQGTGAGSQSSMCALDNECVQAAICQAALAGTTHVHGYRQHSQDPDVFAVPAKVAIDGSASGTAWQEVVDASQRLQQTLADVEATSATYSATGGPALVQPLPTALQDVISETMGSSRFLPRDIPTQDDRHDDQRQLHELLQAQFTAQIAVTAAAEAASQIANKVKSTPQLHSRVQKTTPMPSAIPELFHASSQDLITQAQAALASSHKVLDFAKTNGRYDSFNPLAASIPSFTSPMQQVCPAMSARLPAPGLGDSLDAASFAEISRERQIQQTYWQQQAQLPHLQQGLRQQLEAQAHVQARLQVQVQAAAQAQVRAQAQAQAQIWARLRQMGTQEVPSQAHLGKQAWPPGADPSAKGVWEQRIMLAAAATAAAQAPDNSWSRGARKVKTPAGHRSRVLGNPAGCSPAIGIQTQTDGEGADRFQTLRDHLQELQDTPPANVFIVRKINRLGFNSPGLLKDHFARRGSVQSVLVAHSNVHCPARRSTTRLRPAAMGFVVMATQEEAEAVLVEGEEHFVGGVPIIVQPYKRRLHPAGQPLDVAESNPVDLADIERSEATD